MISLQDVISFFRADCPEVAGTSAVLPEEVLNVPGLKFDDAVGATARGSGTLVFLATYNERSNIAALLDAILALPAACDVLVVDDNSPDGTSRFIAERAAANPRIHLLVRPKRLGIGSAHRLGWLHARRFGYGRIVTMDADMSHQPADIPRLLRALDEGADVALGSRFAPGGKLDYQGWRLFLSRTANWLARKSLGLSLKEYTNSFRAARLDKLPLGLIEGLTNNGYGFFLAETVRTARQGLRVVEIPIHFHDRGAGRSKMPKFQIVLGVANLLYLVFDRRTFKRGENGSDAGFECAHCGKPYVITMHSGARKCLFCMRDHT
jgi:dolichol-phosphate mannosyltransferase